MKVPALNFGDPRLPEGFWAKVHPEPMSGCWLWTAAADKHGYGSYRTGAKAKGKWLPLSGLPHRRTYQALVGEIPPGLMMDHLCRTPPCCNPLHLEPVTPRENIIRGQAIEALMSYKASRTHCSKGHSYAEFGYVRVRTDRVEQYRECNICLKGWHAKAYENQKAKKR